MVGGGLCIDLIGPIGGSTTRHEKHAKPLHILVLVALDPFTHASYGMARACSFKGSFELIDQLKHLHIWPHLLRLLRAYGSTAASTAGRLLQRIED